MITKLFLIASIIKIMREISLLDLPRPVIKSIMETLNELSIKGIDPLDPRYSDALRNALRQHKDKLLEMGIDYNYLAYLIVYLASNLGTNRLLEILKAKISASKRKLEEII